MISGPAQTNNAPCFAALSLLSECQRLGERMKMGNPDVIIMGMETVMEIPPPSLILSV